MTVSTAEFYDAISKDYTESVERCVPKYKEMLSTLFTYLPTNYSPKSILELGGNGRPQLCVRAKAYTLPQRQFYQ